MRQPEYHFEGDQKIWSTSPIGYSEYRQWKRTRATQAQSAK